MGIASPTRALEFANEAVLHPRRLFFGPTYNSS
jgi:hypothetical protein